MMDKRPLHVEYQKMHVKKEMYPPACFEGSLDMLKIPLNSPDLFEKARSCSNDAVYGIHGSFRKLEID